MMMERVGLLCLLLCTVLLLVSSEILHVQRKEGNVALLPCGKLRKGKVTWSRGINGERVNLLTNENGQVTRHIAGLDGRYSSGSNLVLSIFRFSQSDAGRYFCNGTTVELTVRGSGAFTPEGPDKEHIPIRPRVLKMVAGMVAGSCLVAMASVSVLCCYFSRKKAESKIELMYAKVHKPKR